MNATEIINNLKLQLAQQKLLPYFERDDALCEALDQGLALMEHTQAQESALLKQIADICGARIKLGVSVYNAEAVKRYDAVCDILRAYWDRESS